MTKAEKDKLRCDLLEQPTEYLVRELLWLKTRNQSLFCEIRELKNTLKAVDSGKYQRTLAINRRYVREYEEIERRKIETVSLQMQAKSELQEIETRKKRLKEQLRLRNAKELQLLVVSEEKTATLTTLDFNFSEKSNQLFFVDKNFEWQKLKKVLSVEIIATGNQCEDPTADTEKVRVRSGLIL